MKKTILLVATIIFATTIFAQKNPLEGFTTSKEKVIYKFEVRNPNGQKVQKDDLLIGKFTIKFGDTLVADGDKMPSQPMVRIDDASKVFVGDLVDGALLMRKGETCTFAFPKDSIEKLFGGNLPPYFKSGMYAFWTLQIDDIKTPQQQAEEEEEMRKKQEEQMKQQKHVSDSLSALEPGIIQKAIKDYGFENKLTNGIYFKKLSSSTSKETPKATDKVKVHYIGKFVDGKLFDTSVESAAKEARIYSQGRPYEPLPFTIGQGMMIKGFEEGVKMMQKGDKAIILLPSKMAYGERGQGAIAPSTPLIFELELVEIEKAIETPKPQK
ncbi:MAG: FKBP-type peptidyl-prolyl cis-trans isomerase [Bacteroidales bacterium]|jgi:FKBP-type peptidyl-prolyl cis-trans isomerase|nr:FKBP-type peptidyl-prolyl cis-trans isomerase [Bacteroidales bacterium]MDD4703495.1 FKBP-type peptidyl-prolyl cis-trans isomerase [Bacteroidales bacterium]MDX9798810.1 FKBP-type peptidyl-prolyl cis-trans isomerase [Bacteroidales bacterium]